MSIRAISAILATLVTTAVFPTSAHANLLVNGGFEDNNVATGNWAYFASADVNGWDGSNIEIWDNYASVAPAEGSQHAELNAHPSSGSMFSISQDFATVVGQAYDVSFSYRARNGSSSSSAEQFLFSVGPLTATINDHVVGLWSSYSGSFIANSILSTIRFTTANATTEGNFLDGVAVTSRTPVPEPGTLALLGLGLVGLGLRRRHPRVA